MLAILQEFAGHVPQAIESARRTLPADFSAHVWQAITENMLKLHARLQQGLQAL
jgi:serine/threonine-protein kinase HipA